MALNHSKRIGRFTSSQISRLCTSLKSGKPTSAFMTYVEEKADEILMCRVSDVSVNTQAMRWGKLMERVLIDEEIDDKENFNIKTDSEEPKEHPELFYYSGTPDVELIGVKSIEIKCYYPKKFAALSRCLMKQDIELLKNNFPSEYWQTVSNGILCNVDTVELICFMPYESFVLNMVKEINESNFLEARGFELTDYYFLESRDFKLINVPSLPDKAKLKNINRFEFTIPQEDKEFLLERVKLAGSELQKLTEL
jgi:hypothetical protein